MKRNLIIIGLLLVLSLTVGASLALAQDPVPDAVLVCVHQTTGLMEVVDEPGDCNDKRILIGMYTQEGNDNQTAELAARVEALEAENAALQAQVQAQNTRLSALEATVAGMSGQEGRLADLEDKLFHFSRSGNEITITGANLNIVNGMGSTETTNALGNLVIGYNELREGLADVRDGSHMLVVGSKNNYSSYGGIVVGHFNWTIGAYASVSGGYVNNASGESASVSGGIGNRAQGDFSSVSGGYENLAYGVRSSVSGGVENIATGASSSVSGGWSNHALGEYSSVSGGRQRSATNFYDWVAGGLFQEE